MLIIIIIIKTSPPLKVSPPPLEFYDVLATINASRIKSILVAYCIIVVSHPKVRKEMQGKIVIFKE